MAGVAQRIAEIQGLIASVSPRPPGGGAAFARALDDAVAAAGPPSAPASTPLPSLSAQDLLAGSLLRPAGSAPAAVLTADGAPAALAPYGNGRAPAGALTPLGEGSHRLWAPAAEGFSRLAAAAARDGVDIGVTDSYRSYDAQVDVARRKGLYSQGGLAAEPGTSQHGWGRSLDLRLDGEAQSWMRTNAGRFGFAEDTPREPWHWTFTPR